MTELLRVVGRVILGWFGVSIMFAGVWMLLSAAVQRRDATSALYGLSFILVGGALLWRALSDA
jgi:hypothetical protein